MLSCKTIISVNGQSPVECLPVTHESRLMLCETGVASADLAAASLELDEHDELVVLKTAEISVALERGGRKLQLRSGKSIRICENDILWIGESSIRIVKSTFVIYKTERKSPFMRTARKVIAASAAVISMAAFSACEENSCEPGAQKCDGGKVMTCQAYGEWKVSEVCSDDSVCIEHDNKTASCNVDVISGDMPPAECHSGEMKCDGDSVMECTDGYWEVAETCKNATCIEASNTSAYCEANDLGGVLPYDGRDDCSKPGEMMCEDNNVYRCDEKNGRWEVAEKCTDGAVCVESSNTSAYCEVEVVGGEAPPFECDPGEMRCDGNKAMICKDGFWEVAKKCIDGAVCVESSNTSAYCEVEVLGGDAEPPTDECDSGAMRCDGNKAMICKDGSWAVSEICADAEDCIEESNTSAHCDVSDISGVAPPMNECEAGQMKCENNNVYACSDGFWAISKECKKHEECIEISNDSAVCDMEIMSGEEPYEPD
ncbi:MAG: hypothetical protein IJM59_10545 [Proteobacteria bacterium]|nr:hypothetical protein [Pseudomonadota bacterium]